MQLRVSDARVTSRRGPTPTVDAMPPLPIEAYADDAWFARERAAMFRPNAGPLYLTHDALLPPAGHVRADGDDRVLVTCDGAGRVAAFANLCTHSLRPLVGDGEPSTSSCVTCPFHHWSFRRDGSLIGGRDITLSQAERDRLALTPFVTRSWHGLHFAGTETATAEFEADLAYIEDAFAQRGIADWLDFADWTLAGSEDETYLGDWKTFLEVYGDCYHVPPYHPGLASFSDCATLEWAFGDQMHAQFLDLSAEGGGRTAPYRAWVDGLHHYYRARGERTPTTAVVWTCFYPNLMVEYYNGLRVISVVLPTGPASYLNRVHYFVPSDMEDLVPGLPATILEAYGETAVQDRVLNESRHHGIVTARELDIDVVTYNANVCGPAPELGTVHFHGWWRDRMRRSAGQ